MQTCLFDTVAIVQFICPRAQLGSHISMSERSLQTDMSLDSYSFSAVLYCFLAQIQLFVFRSIHLHFAQIRNGLKGGRFGDVLYYQMWPYWNKGSPFSSLLQKEVYKRDPRNQALHFEHFTCNFEYFNSLKLSFGFRRSKCVRDTNIPKDIILHCCLCFWNI